MWEKRRTKRRILVTGVNLVLFFFLHLSVINKVHGECENEDITVFELVFFVFYSMKIMISSSGTGTWLRRDKNGIYLLKSTQHRFFFSNPKQRKTETKRKPFVWNWPIHCFCLLTAAYQNKTFQSQKEKNYSIFWWKLDRLMTWFGLVILSSFFILCSSRQNKTKTEERKTEKKNDFCFVNFMWFHTMDNYAIGLSFKIF